MTWWEQLLSQPNYKGLPHEQIERQVAATEPRCPECGWLLRRVTSADGQCACYDPLSSEFILEDLLDAEIIE